MIIARPFKDKLLNVFMIMVEVCITICYSASGCLLFSEINKEHLMWIIIGSIYFSYFLHSSLGYYKIFAILYPIIKNCFTRIGTSKENTIDNTTSKKVHL